MRPPRRIRDAHDALVATQWLSGPTSSLSPRVRDALFAFWRLPLALRHATARALPDITLDASAGTATVDWARLADCFNGSGSPTETAWAFALQAEAAVDRTLLNADSEANAVRVATTHGEHVKRLLPLLHTENGEFYMAFVVLITVLERALYDLYHDRVNDSGGSGDSEPTRTTRTRKKKKNLILRDLLQSEAIAQALPDGLVRLLHVLFLPTGLNWRNLVWHGFVVPAEVPRCVGCLVVVLVLALPPRSRHMDGEDGEATASESLFHVRSYDHRLLFQRQTTTTADNASSSSAYLSDLVDASEAISSSSPFVPPGRRPLVTKAFRALSERQDELWFLFALLPVLEHAIRVAFVSTNRTKWGVSSAYGAAQVDAYYSTLDGFGQREKHQVLLHPHVVVEGGATGTTRLNQLYTTLPSAALAVALDLFMMASGPNLRAKLCHGEADLSTLLRSRPTGEHDGIAVATELVALAWLSICRASSGRRVAAANGSVEAAVEAFETHYVSSFHPFYQLERATEAAFATATELTALRQRYTHMELSPVDTVASSEPLVLVVFEYTRDSSGTRVGVVEKESRLRDFYRLLQTDGLFTWRDSRGDTTVPTEPPPLPSRGSFPDLLERLHVTLRDVFAALERHHTTHHSTERRGAFLTLIGTTAAEVTPSDSSVPVGLDSRSSLLLALSDDDGLSVAGCMLETVASAERASRRFQTRLIELHELVATGRARTNHRRSFLHMVLFLPVFEAVLTVCLSLVEHQLAHFRLLALDSADSRSSLGGSQCPQAERIGLLQRKLLLFVTAFEGCAGSSNGGGDTTNGKSVEKALQLALQFFGSKALGSVLTAL